VNNLEKTEEFIRKNGALVDSRDSRGRCPIHIASANGYLELVKYIKFQSYIEY